MLRVLVADGQPVFLDGLREYIAPVADLIVVAEAVTGHDAVTRAAAQQPDVAVVNIDLAGIDGLAVTRLITPGVAVLMVSDLDKEDLSAAMSAGAAGYVTKHAEPDDILTAIRVVARGGLYADPTVARRIRRRLSDPVEFPTLTTRERQVFKLLALDSEVTAIAGSLGITKKTVGRHMTNLMAKLPAETRDDAIRIARAAHS